MSIKTELHKTSKVARIKWNGKTLRRIVYEFYDDEKHWWSECVRLGSMSQYNPNAYIPLDHFDEYTIRDEGAYIPGTYAAW